MSEKDQLIKLVDEAVLKLREHCDTVHIFVTLQVDDAQETMSYESGKGNFYARQGQVQEFITVQEQYQRNWTIRKDKPEEGEE